MSSENGNGEEGNGIANLRAEFEKRGKELETALAELNTFRAKERTSTVAQLLKAKGVPEAAAKFYNAEDVSEDAVTKWADENRALFGAGQSAGQSTTTTASQPTGPSPVDQINDAMHQNADELPGPSVTGQIVGDPEQIAHALNTLPYDELVKLGYMPQANGLYGGPIR
jgi:hypothetical protein